GVGGVLHGWWGKAGGMKESCVLPDGRIVELDLDTVAGTDGHAPNRIVDERPQAGLVEPAREGDGHAHHPADVPARERGGAPAGQRGRGWAGWRQGARPALWRVARPLARPAPK